ncbi:hypothetical protein FNV43_RR15987 [Rhamnella rubrinervis]|uniref:Protein kinase domain-containing protein n=1 Tax=Rhamnella rubrinervis TaxID=2594499 RepID=A0A8K0E4I8_9ROSA|nr:hypothetical protein FNV43_RR15987 [Rhamnella rubrinervis]
MNACRLQLICAKLINALALVDSLFWKIKHSKAKIRKNKNTELQEKPADQIKPTAEILEANSSVSAKGDSKNGEPVQTFQFDELTAATSSGKDNSEILETNSSLSAKEASENGGSAQTFKFCELAAATRNFRAEVLHEGGFGRIYKGHFKSTNQVVAIKQFDRDGLKGNREFLTEVLLLSLLHHPNVINLIGYCADGDQRLTVYEYMPLGSLEDHLHDISPHKEHLDWSIRMKIAAGVAKGLEYLHDGANPPVICRNLKCCNILLGEGYHPKLSDFGLAKLGPVGDKMHVSTRVMGTYGYVAPEYAMTGQLTLKADIYNFGVVLLEIITGRKAIDTTRPIGEENLVAWARPLFKDRSKFSQMADPMLRGQYPVRSLYQALAVAAMCLQEQSNLRPNIANVVTALTYLASREDDPTAQPLQSSCF